MTSAGANTWSVPLEINNLESQISSGGSGVQSISVGNTNLTLGGTAQNPILSGTLTNLTSSVAGNNNFIAGMSAPPFGTSAIVCAGTDTFLIEDTANVPLLAVANTGLVLGGGGTLTTVPVQAPTVAVSTTNDTQVATTAFVQSVIGSTANVASITAGTNISIDNTNPNIPIVSLATPLTSAVQASNQIVGGSTTDGIPLGNTSEWKFQSGETNPGQEVYGRLTYGRDIGTASEQSGKVELKGDTAQMELNTSWINAPNSTTASFLRSYADNSVLNFQTTAPLTQGSANITATTTGVNKTFSGFGTANIGRIAEAVDDTQARQAVSFNNGSFTFSTFNESVANASRARLRSVYAITGSTLVSHIMDTTSAGCELNQIYQSGATTRLGTITTNGSGMFVNSDNALTISSGFGANVSITGSGSGNVVVEGVNFNTTTMSAPSIQMNSTAGNNDIGATGGSVNLTATVGINANAGTTAGNTNPTTITSAGVGGALNPQLRLENTNATGSCALEVFKNKPTAGANGDVLHTQSVFGKDSVGVKQEYTRITHTIRDATAGVEDGSLELGCFVNGGFANFIQLNANDAPIGEVNFTRPLDFIGGSDANATIKVGGAGSVNLNLDTTTSVGTGAIALKTKDGTAGSGGGLLLTGNTLLSASAGGNSGQHLCLTIGGTVYKIALLNA